MGYRKRINPINITEKDNVGTNAMLFFTNYLCRFMHGIKCGNIIEKDNVDTNAMLIFYGLFVQTCAWHYYGKPK